MTRLSVQCHYLILISRQTTSQCLETRDIKFTFTVSLCTNIRNNTHYIFSNFRCLECKYCILCPVIFRTENCKMLLLYHFLSLIEPKRKSVQILVRSPYLYFLTGKSRSSCSHIQRRCQDIFAKVLQCIDSAVTGIQTDRLVTKLQSNSFLFFPNRIISLSQIHFSTKI